VSFVCHSMGGLVVRAFTYISGASDFIRKVVTLGTPHIGTMQDSGLIDYSVKWGEFVTSAMPGFSNKECLSLKELRGTDQPNPLLKSLKQQNSAVDAITRCLAHRVAIRIELGINPVLNYVANRTSKSAGEWTERWT
jgi:triacylglycerol esterase/lipase EstA (alpha/beta hydrolase family)